MTFQEGKIHILGCQAATFTVDNTVNKVTPIFSLQNFVGPNAGLGNFQARENLILQSAWVCMPYCFSFADTQITLEMDWQDTGGNDGIIEPIGNDGLFIPIENVETPLNIFIAWPNDLADLPTHFRGQVTGADVSMLNVPDSLNGLDMPIWAYIKVLSTYGVI